ncbi:formyltransferase family protein [Kordiimonas aestuarii]|uniref:formyltransferase family protein n=1 Tax=Kordiimonas aestuarii TaxID=1005925 RepID=UPI0021CF27AC|nr:formyltransferase family protein [Kordiimonas aestuarii]
MKVVFITGDHPRHSYIARALASTGHLTAIISERRDAFVPEPPAHLSEALKTLFRHHFAKREGCEARHFGTLEWPDIPRHDTTMDALNGKETQALLSHHKPDLLLSYGCHMLSSETLDCVVGERWNIHGGLSPWYKGAITHFWPSYMLEPQMTGMTVHDLTTALDAGDVVHQCAADLVRGDGLHDLAARAVLKLAKELPDLIEKLARGEKIKKHAHKTTGKLWPSRDWRPEHLHTIYTVYNDRIVDHYLDGAFEKRAPKLHRQV